jgi:Uma2 family endonuclease
MMATLVSPAPPRAEDPIWRLSVEQYHAMIDAGILSSDSPVELVEGLLLEKMSHNPPHRFATVQLRNAILRILPAGWEMMTQVPITLADSEPEPDIFVARGSNLDYPDRHPGPGDVAMVVEISDSTIAQDRGIKQRVYARAGIPIYLIVDVNSRRVEIRTDPEGDAYRALAVLSSSDAIPFSLDGAQIGAIQVASLFP